MGNVIMPSGGTVWVDELQGSVLLSRLIQDARTDDYTPPYRIAVISALGKLGQNARPAIKYLKDLCSKEFTGDRLLVSNAAEQAIARIESDRSSPRSTTPSGVQSNLYNHNNSTATKPSDPQKITFTEVKGDELHDGTLHYPQCHFCGKLTLSNSASKRFANHLCDGKFYCNFCIRNDYYMRTGSNVMILTFKGIFAYYYYAYYVMPKASSMYANDVKEYVEGHIRIGLQNPIFHYDPETFYWFIDFGKVGKRKMPVSSVLETIIAQLAIFNLYENVKDSSPQKLYEKYKEGVMEFYNKRERPQGNVLVPTLWGCGIPTKCPHGTDPVPIEALTGFTPSRLEDNNIRQKKCL